MTWKLTATITHKSFDSPVIKEVYYQADSLQDVLDKIKEEAKTPDDLIFNLKHHRRCAFKDINGVKHSWLLKEFDDIKR